MTVYYLVFAFLLLLALPSSKDTRRAREILAVLILLFLGGLRHEVGTDWYSYSGVYDAISNGESFGDFREERGFLSLMHLVASVDGGYALFVFTLFALALGIKVIAVKVYGADLNAALLIYFSAIFLIYDVNGVRQGMAMGIVMLAGWAAYRGQVIRFLGGITLAASMHVISLIALPLYGMTRTLFFLRNPWQRLVLLLVGCVVSYSVAEAVSSSNLAQYLELVNLADRYDYYMDAFDTRFDPLGPGTRQRIVVALAVVFLIDSVSAPQRLKALLFNCHAVALWAYFLFSFNMEFMARISYYYKCFDVITLALILSAQQSPERRMLYLLFLALVTGAQVFQILRIPEGGLVPYQSLLRAG